MSSAVVSAHFPTKLHPVTPLMRGTGWAFKHLYGLDKSGQSMTLDMPDGLDMPSDEPGKRTTGADAQKLIERIRCADNPDTTSLLSSGEALLSADDESRRLVGIAALEVVALGSEETDAIAALENLADHMQGRFANSHDGEECRATCEALCKAGMIGRHCDRKLTFAAAESHDLLNGPHNRRRDPRWRLVGGVAISRYFGGRIVDQIISSGDGQQNGIWCNAVKLVDCTIVDDNFGSSCLLTRCRILRYNPERPFINGLVYCDFSGCHVSQAGFLADLRDHGCWYDPVNPPQGDLPVKWTAFLHRGDPGIQSSWEPLLDTSLATRH